MFGSPETTSGGRALKFYALVRMDVRRVTAIKAQGEIIGHRTRVRVTKNKVAPPFRVAEFDIMFGEGISREGDLMDVGLELNVVDKRGSFYYYDGERFAQGRENAKAYLKENPEFANTLEDLIRQKLSEMKDIPLELGARADIEEGSVIEEEF